VINLKEMLSIPEAEGNIKPKIIVLQRNEKEFAFLVDDVMGNRKIKKSEVQSPPSTFTGIKKDLLQGITNDKLIILNCDSIFNKSEFVVNKTLGENN